MKVSKTSFLLSFVMAVGAIGAHANPLVKIDGSSTVFPITEALAEEFQTSKRGAVKVTVGISGTGGGFKKFCRGEIDVQNASRPIQVVGKTGEPGELENCRKAGVRFFELPIAFDATAVVVHPSNSFIKQMTVDELKKAWAPESQGKVMTWKQVNPAWPDQPLKLYGAGADSGTFDYFTEAIVGKAKSSRGDYTPSEDDNVLVKGIAGDRNALGYMPFAYYQENKDKLKLVAVVSPKGNAVLPSRETVESGTYAPLSRPLFLYVNADAYAKRAEVRDFVEFYMKNAARLVPQVKYVPLPAEVYDLILGHAKKGKVGTVFGGRSQVGLTIQELVKKEKSL
jgi:phosphate transport system substrate-binding protein